MKNIVVAFPGIAYTTERPLLKNTTNKYRELGYEVININFDNVDFNKNKDLNKSAEEVKAVVLEQVKNICFKEYKNIVFVSKSLGTMVAVWLEEHLNLNVKHVLLTPLPKVIPYIKQYPEKIILTAIGTEDKFLDYKILEETSKENNVKCFIYKGLGHSLEGDDPKVNENVIKDILDVCK